MVDTQNGDGEHERERHATTKAATAEARPRDGDVALLVDWENLKWGLREHFRVAPNITSLIAAAREHGRLVVARAYGDWTQPQLAIDAPNLYRAGIEPIYAQGRHQVDGTPLKNSADVRLAVDAVALCAQLPHVRTYILVTGDGDLVHPLNFIRLNGHRVIVIAVRATTSLLLESSADAILVYERDIEPLEATRPRPRNLARTMDDALARLGQLLPSVLTGRDAKQSFTALNEQLLGRFGFNARDYDVSFKELMLAGAERGLVEITTEGSMDFAVLPGYAATAADEDEEDEEKHDAVAVPGPVFRGDVRLETLAADDQRRLIDYLDRLEATSRFLTVSYIVQRVSHTSVVPMLAESQLRGLLLNAIRDGVFTVSEVPAVNRATGESFVRKDLRLNRSHATVRAMMELIDAGEGW